MRPDHVSVPVAPDDTTMQASHPPRGALLAGTILITALAVAGATGCLKRTGRAESGTAVPTRHVRVPAQWTNISYCCAISFDEFVATGNFESWAEWCEANEMTAGPHRATVSVYPCLLSVKADLRRGSDTGEHWEVRQTEPLPSGATKASWFDPVTKRIVFQEGFW